MTIDDFEAMVRIKMVEKAAMEEVGTKQALKVEIQSESWKQTYFLTFVQCKLFLCTVCFSPTWQLIDLFWSNGHRWILKYLSMVVVSMSECFHSNISLCSNVIVLKSKIKWETYCSHIKSWNLFLTGYLSNYRKPSYPWVDCSNVTVTGKIGVNLLQWPP